MSDAKFFTVEVEGKYPYTRRGNLLIAPLRIAKKVAQELGGKPVQVDNWRSGCCMVVDADGFTFYPTEWRGNESAN